MKSAVSASHVVSFTNFRYALGKCRNHTSVNNIVCFKWEFVGVAALNIVCVCARVRVTLLCIFLQNRRDESTPQKLRTRYSMYRTCPKMADSNGYYGHTPKFTSLNFPLAHITSSNT